MTGAFFAHRKIKAALTIIAARLLKRGWKTLILVSVVPDLTIGPVENTGENNEIKNGDEAE